MIIFCADGPIRLPIDRSNHGYFLFQHNYFFKSFLYLDCITIQKLRKVQKQNRRRERDRINEGEEVCPRGACLTLDLNIVLLCYVCLSDFLHRSLDCICMICTNCHRNLKSKDGQCPHAKICKLLAAAVKGIRTTSKIIPGSCFDSRIVRTTCDQIISVCSETLRANR